MIASSTLDSPPLRSHAITGSRRRRGIPQNGSVESLLGLLDGALASMDVRKDVCYLHGEPLIGAPLAGRFFFCYAGCGSGAAMIFSTERRASSIGPSAPSDRARRPAAVLATKPR